MIFDTHAHYDDEAFDEDRDEVLNFSSGVGSRNSRERGCEYGRQQAFGKLK